VSVAVGYGPEDRGAISAGSKGTSRLYTSPPGHGAHSVPCPLGADVSFPGGGVKEVGA
jgi:hypothetical protein